ncbi:threonine-phosphate decarboxylase CobD [Dethiosulfatarculus sandiegensis]|uniref:threonine-phosphate decarboxylase n=1 Tax=Dethiosulfatarculus sandiegensis TaxID=1429043 RepID=A0A0D2IZS0_9BACT|nr:threonine-phosphate decarboxylase CobD [Dethiosulfatarculus sandiegensis]KIX11479.1 L-threonine-O-3-phosphate decarboxylase [Dethiosulfatarculus sandiegensis]
MPEHKHITNPGLTGQAAFHGGDIWGAARRLEVNPDRILDLSASLNPLGPPAGLDKILAQSFKRICHYPDRHNTLLKEALAKQLGLNSKNLIVGNGSTALIRLLSRALDLKTILILAPSFGEFPRSMALTGRHFHFLSISESQNFTPTTVDIDRIWAHDPSCVVLTNPVSPTGTLVEREFLDTLLAQAMARRTWMIVDEAFIDFAPDQARKWSPPLVQKYPRLIVLRSMTKFYCLAGLRLGYMMGHTDTLAHIEPLGEPWSVNTPAHDAGIYCLAQNEYALKTRKAVDKWREEMKGKLTGMGLVVYPSQVNYLLTRLPHTAPTADIVSSRTAEQGVLVRDCQSFPGCGPRHLRFAVTTTEEQKRLFKALETALKS